MPQCSAWPATYPSGLARERIGLDPRQVPVSKSLVMEVGLIGLILGWPGTEVRIAEDGRRKRAESGSPVLAGGRLRLGAHPGSGVLPIYKRDEGAENFNRNL